MKIPRSPPEKNQLPLYLLTTEVQIESTNKKGLIKND